MNSPLKSGGTATACPPPEVLSDAQPPSAFDRADPAEWGPVLGDRVADPSRQWRPQGGLAALTVPDRATFVLPAALSCGLESVVAEPPDPRVRAAAISAVVEEIFQSAAWVHGGDVGHPELASLAQLVAAAHAHQARIAVLELGGVA